MKLDWILDINFENYQNVRLGLKDSENNIIYLTDLCSSLDQLEHEVQTIKTELDQLVSQAKEEYQKMREDIKRDEAEDPERIWENMESYSSDQEMFQYFNALDEELRKQVAEYVFSKVSMIRGKAPIFAEHYDVFSNLLE